MDGELRVASVVCDQALVTVKKVIADGKHGGCLVPKKQTRDVVLTSNSGGP